MPTVIPTLPPWDAIVCTGMPLGGTSGAAWTVISSVSVEAGVVAASVEPGVVAAPLDPGWSPRRSPGWSPRHSSPGWSPRRSRPVLRHAALATGRDARSRPSAPGGRYRSPARSGAASRCGGREGVGAARAGGRRPASAASGAGRAPPSSACHSAGADRPTRAVMSGPASTNGRPLADVETTWTPERRVPPWVNAVTTSRLAPNRRPSLTPRCATHRDRPRRSNDARAPWPLSRARTAAPGCATTRMSSGGRS